MEMQRVTFFSARQQSIDVERASSGVNKIEFHIKMKKQSYGACFSVQISKLFSLINKFLTTIVVQYNFQYQHKNSSMESPNGKPLSEEAISNAVENIFKKYDQNHNNFIDFSQFRKLIEDLNLSPKLRVSLREITSIFKLLDVDGDGRVSRQEFIDALCEVKDTLM